MTIESTAPSPHPKSLPKYARDKDRPYVGNPWDRQQGEPKKAHSCFLIYRDMDPGDRTLIGAERIYRKKNDLPLEKCTGQVASNWNRKHRWEERVEAWDNFMAAKKKAALTRRAIKRAEEHADMAADALMVASAPSTKLAQRMREQAAAAGEDFLDQYSDEDLMKLAKVFGDSMPTFMKAERDALSGVGEATVTPAKLNAKAQKLRAIMGNKQLVGMLESISVELTTEDPSGAADTA